MLELRPDEMQPRHWSRRSQRFTGGDALAQGWHVEGVVVRDEMRYNGGRKTNIYHFTLQNGDNDWQVMSVIGNPFVTQFIRDHDLVVEDSE